MWTLVHVSFSSEGAPASEIDKIMKNLGFMTILGEHDYVYRWKTEDILTDEDYREMEKKVLELINRVQSELKGKQVYLHFKTIRSF